MTALSLSTKQKYGTLLAGNIAGTGSSYWLISRTNGTGASTTISFTSIPSTYTHLQIRGFAHSPRTAGTDAGIQMQVNSDTGTNYSFHRLSGDGATASASALTTTAYFYNDDITADNGNASTYATFVIDILDYANTNKYKTLRALHGFDKNGSGQVKLLSGNWRNTNAITSISFVTDTAFTTASSLALYGIKGA
jgi:hypothetical protein